MTNLIPTFTLYSTAALSGFFLAHSIVLGAFFDDLIRSGNAAVIRSSYSPFRARGHSVKVYFLCFFIQFVLSVSWFALTLVQRGATFAVLPFVLAFPLLGVLHSVTGFNKLESGILSGKLTDEKSLRTFQKQNLPIHLIDAALYALPVVLYSWTFLSPS